MRDGVGKVGRVKLGKRTTLTGSFRDVARPGFLWLLSWGFDNGRSDIVVNQMMSRDRDDDCECSPCNMSSNETE